MGVSSSYPFNSGSLHSSGNHFSMSSTLSSCTTPLSTICIAATWNALSKALECNTYAGDELGLREDLGNCTRLVSHLALITSPVFSSTSTELASPKFTLPAWLK
jgi:hypothetical protein